VRREVGRRERRRPLESRLGRRGPDGLLEVKVEVRRRERDERREQRACVGCLARARAVLACPSDRLERRLMVVLGLVVVAAGGRAIGGRLAQDADVVVALRPASRAPLEAVVGLLLLNRLEVGLRVRRDGRDLARPGAGLVTGAKAASDKSSLDPGRDDAREVKRDRPIGPALDLLARIDEVLDAGLRMR
jgi:hypothetical protein